MNFLQPHLQQVYVIFCTKSLPFLYLAFLPARVIGVRPGRLALVKQQKILLWPVALFQKHQIDLNRSFHYNETALNQLTDALAIFDPSYIEAPENAHLRITDDDYTIVNETPGNTPIRDEIIKEIQKAIDDRKA